MMPAVPADIFPLMYFVYFYCFFLIALSVAPALVFAFLFVGHSRPCEPLCEHLRSKVVTGQHTIALVFICDRRNCSYRRTVRSAE